jgi:hypothetical protein
MATDAILRGVRGDSHDYAAARSSSFHFFRRNINCSAGLRRLFYARAASSASPNDHGEIVVAVDNKDIASLSSGEAGPQYHLRITRAYCDHRGGSSQSAADQASYYCVPDTIAIDDAHPPSTTPNKSYLIAPYNFGMAVEYPRCARSFRQGFFAAQRAHALH